MKRPLDPDELRLYFGTIVQLIWPGHVHQVPDTYGDVHPGDLQHWPRENLQVLLAEGRRHLERANENFERLRTRAQWLFTTTLAYITLALSQSSTAAEHPGTFVLWYLGLAAAFVAALGSAAVFLATAQLGTVDSVLLSNEPPDADLDRVLAEAYTTAARTTANLLNVRFTILRDALWFLVLGLTLQAATWTTIVLLTM